MRMKMVFTKHRLQNDVRTASERSHTVIELDQSIC